MIGKTISVSLLFLILLVACTGKKSSNPLSSESPGIDKPLGTLTLNISVAAWHPMRAKSAAIQTMDSVKVFAYSPSGNKVTEQSLTLNGTRWLGNVSVPAQSNMRVTLVYYGGAAVRYLGEKSGVNVASGGTTPVDITVYYLGLSVLSPDSASADFQVKWMSRPLVTSYQLQQDTKSDFSTATTVYTGSDTTSTVPISGKTDGQTYYYRARVNTEYGYGPWYSKGGSSTVGNTSGTIIISTPDLPDEWPDTEVTQGITMKIIPAGSFTMGSPSGVNEEKPAHTVTLSSFEMGIYEITQAQYKSVTGLNPSYFRSDDNLPVEQVNWWDAIRFCNALSVKAGLGKCYDESTGACDFSKKGFRLPTEAEWEYACRAGVTTAYNLGDTESDLNLAGWYYYNSEDRSRPVGGKIPNNWGLYDMHGNIWEWCNDWYGDYTSDNQTNPTGAPSGTLRVARGGSWNYPASGCRSASRYPISPGAAGITLGFRVVRGIQ